MTFNLPYFLAALGLLWLPLPLTVGTTVAYRNVGRAINATIAGLLRPWQNWVDLCRSGAGIYLLLNHSIILDPDDVKALSHCLYLKLGIVGAGVWLQMVRFGPGVLFFAPIFYVCGLTSVIGLPAELTASNFGALLWAAGPFAVLFGWAFAWGMKDPRFLLPVMGAALLIAEYFVGSLNLLVLLNVAVIFAAPACALASQKRLLFVSREHKPVGFRAETEDEATPAPAPDNLSKPRLAKGTK